MIESLRVDYFEPMLGFEKFNFIEKSIYREMTESCS